MFETGFHRVSQGFMGSRRVVKRFMGGAGFHKGLNAGALGFFGVYTRG